MSMSQRIQDLRKQGGHSQEQLADLLEVSRQAVSKWESGQGSPDVHNVCKLCALYGVSTDYVLLGRDEQSSPPVPHATGMDPVFKRALAIVLTTVGMGLSAFLFIFLLTLLS